MIKYFLKQIFYIYIIFVSVYIIWDRYIYWHDIEKDVTTYALPSMAMLKIHEYETFSGFPSYTMSISYKNGVKCSETPLGVGDSKTPPQFSLRDEQIPMIDIYSTYMEGRIKYHICGQLIDINYKYTQ